MIIKLIDFSRYARAKDLNGVVTQLAAWGAGILVLFLVAQTNWAPTIIIGDTALNKLGIWSLVFAGMSAASVASVAKDTLKAVDNTNSAAMPTLLPAPQPKRPRATARHAK